ncbi:glutathione S-transferase family protein [Pseudobacteriovorax antillogorgiicola]|uniref:glutathione transferase n=1 Tax=Pseudobacteriovorax antillogorgiicola TaxID=1513793 RepID=A0A1Y6CDE7_9BACT|nr:glutathione S-transferase [Pseudobacteriovorax antillogorgiicola]TCS47932.1 glutathione S-transferase [Pseudobacteriovorax antillogorgiicola]SMF57998.1 Glutathione S-transferase [Pseudobacteriovorax antillogorgiicola]
MIKLHHLNQSRSQRILWLLEELSVDYEIIRYQRQAKDSLAPPELKEVHPLGKSPVIEFEGKVMAESGAITQFLIDRFAPDRLAPPSGSASWFDYLYWISFAESSAMIPLLLQLFIHKDGAETNFIHLYAQDEVNKVLSHLDQSLEGKRYLVDDRLTGADMMVSFVVDVLKRREILGKYPNIERYSHTLSEHESYQKAIAIEAQNS